MNFQSGNKTGNYTSPVLWMRIWLRDSVQINNATFDWGFRGRDLFKFSS